MENNNKMPNWYWILAVFFLLWNIMGVFSFYVHTFISADTLAQLPENERVLYNEYPIWITVIFGIAVFFGLMGSIGLILKKKWSKIAFVISILAIIPQMIHNVFFTKSIDVYGLLHTITMPVLVVAFGLFLVWFSMFSIKRNWLN
ncbi:hypothetical protein SAMN04489761_1323 [Tenacibaculum sp. MAR_2009_124]|uniref:hypothetical protein n=1 Tax=Tenacibaculum sp. MAR_2009_124 TaxID=1250059 RepID=UPI000896283F|nr:hypothetical protein [Tenacibaculum sp. MAR_2009_124]SEB54652.1 hypothetical protein SAMN04489761_1323 [Tenacibaculum sp. MAR_2009_124]